MSWPLGAGAAAGALELLEYDPIAHAVLSNALKGRKPLRTFDFKLEDFPEAREAWLRYQTVQLREYAITWLRDNDLEPVRH